MRIKHNISGSVWLSKGNICTYSDNKRSLDSSDNYKCIHEIKGDFGTIISEIEILNVNLTSYIRYYESDDCYCDNSIKFGTN